MRNVLTRNIQLQKKLKYFIYVKRNLRNVIALYEKFHALEGYLLWDDQIWRSRDLNRTPPPRQVIWWIYGCKMIFLTNILPDGSVYF